MSESENFYFCMLVRFKRNAKKTLSNIQEDNRRNLIERFFNIKFRLFTRKLQVDEEEIDANVFKKE